MLVIREIQSGKLKEFNEALKEKFVTGEEAVAWIGGEGVGSEFHILI